MKKHPKPSSIQMGAFQTFLFGTLLVICAIKLDTLLMTPSEREKVHDTILQRHAEEQCHLLEQQEEYRREWEERVKAFENDKLHKGATSSSRSHTDKIGKGKPTEVGYGVTNGEIEYGKRFGILKKHVSLPSSLSRDEAELWFATVTMPTYTKCVESVVKKPLSPQQKFALISFTHNLGIGSLRQLMSHKDKDIPSIMRKYVYAGGKERMGLVKRREWEASLWEEGVISKSRQIASR